MLDFNDTWIFSANLKKNSQIWKLMTTRPLGNELFQDRQTGRQAERQTDRQADTQTDRTLSSRETFDFFRKERRTSNTKQADNASCSGLWVC